jgi:hypothetical protein
VGYEHTCALLGDGGVACWGRNADGELGIGSTDPDGAGVGTAPGSMGAALRRASLGEPPRPAAAAGPAGPSGPGPEQQQQPHRPASKMAAL